MKKWRKLGTSFLVALMTTATVVTSTCITTSCDKSTATWNDINDAKDNILSSNLSMLNKKYETAKLKGGYGSIDESTHIQTEIKNNQDNLSAQLNKISSSKDNLDDIYQDLLSYSSSIGINVADWKTLQFKINETIKKYDLEIKQTIPDYEECEKAIGQFHTNIDNFVSQCKQKKLNTYEILESLNAQLTDFIPETDRKTKELKMKILLNNLIIQSHDKVEQTLQQEKNSQQITLDNLYDSGYLFKGSDIGAEKANNLAYLHNDDPIGRVHWDGDDKCQHELIVKILGYRCTSKAQTIDVQYGLKTKVDKDKLESSENSEPITVMSDATYQFHVKVTPALQQKWAQEWFEKHKLTFNSTYTINEFMKSWNVDNELRLSDLKYIAKINDQSIDENDNDGFDIKCKITQIDTSANTVYYKMYVCSINNIDEGEEGLWYGSDVYSQRLKFDQSALSDINKTYKLINKLSYVFNNKSLVETKLVLASIAILSTVFIGATVCTLAPAIYCAFKLRIFSTINLSLATFCFASCAVILTKKVITLDHDLDKLRKIKEKYINEYQQAKELLKTNEICQNLMNKIADGKEISMNEFNYLTKTFESVQPTIDKLQDVINKEKLNNFKPWDTVFDDKIIWAFGLMIGGILTCYLGQKAAPEIFSQSANSSQQQSQAQIEQINAQSDGSLLSRAKALIDTGSTYVKWTFNKISCLFNAIGWTTGLTGFLTIFIGVGPKNFLWILAAIVFAVMTGVYKLIYHVVTEVW